MIAAARVAVSCCATASILKSITTINIADSSRTYSTLTNILGPLANLTTWQWFRECLLETARLQKHPTSSDQELSGSATISGVSASVEDVLQFHVFLQHSSLLNCRCRSISEHRSSSLGSVIEFPSSCTLLESKRSPRLLRLIMQQTSANMTCVSTCVCIFRQSLLSCSVFRANHRPHQSPHGPATLHSTQPLDFLHVCTPWLFHVSCETPHRFSDVHSVLSNKRQLHHRAAVQSRLH